MKHNVLGFLLVIIFMILTDAKRSAKTRTKND